MWPEVSETNEKLIKNKSIKTLWPSPGSLEFSSKEEIKIYLPKNQQDKILKNGLFHVKII